MAQYPNIGVSGGMGFMVGNDWANGSGNVDKFMLLGLVGQRIPMTSNRKFRWFNRSGSLANNKSDLWSVGAGSWL